MFSINTLLEKFKNITPPNGVVRQLISDVIKKEIGIEIEKKDISVQNNIAYIKTKPAYKNEIYIKKQQILSLINSKNGKTTLIDIR